MLQQYKLVEHEGMFTVGPELEDVPCYICGGESVVNACPGDGRLHHHGQVHVPEKGLQAVCANCIQLVKAEWQMLRTESFRP
jgi:hypothetical protein